MAENDIEQADRILNQQRRDEEQAKRQRERQHMQELESYNWRKARENKGKK